MRPDGPLLGSVLTCSGLTDLGQFRTSPNALGWRPAPKFLSAHKGPTHLRAFENFHKTHLSPPSECRNCHNGPPDAVVYIRGNSTLPLSGDTAIQYIRGCGKQFLGEDCIQQCYDLRVSNNRRNAAAITILNLKGGVGKTHTAWLLAGVCAERGYRCLCIDLDTQGNLTRNLLVGESPVPGVEMLFHPGGDGDAPDLIRASTLPSVDLISSNSAVTSLDVTDQRQWEAADLQRSLHDALEPVRDEYDYIICDCPPRLSLVSYSALVASSHVIVPLEAADWGAQGVTQVAEAVRYVQRRDNDKLSLTGYVISRFKAARKYQHSYLTKLREHFGDLTGAGAFVACGSSGSKTRASTSLIVPFLAVTFRFLRNDRFICFVSFFVYFRLR